MAEEQNRVVKTYPDGVRATLTLDSQTGAILDYSIDNSNKQANADAAVNLQLLTERVEALEKAPKGTAEDLKALKDSVEVMEKYYTEIFLWAKHILLAFSSTSKIGDKYATGKCLPFAVELPEGVYAYTIDENQDLRNVTKYKLLGDGKYVPANTPVILMSAEKVSKNFRVVYSSKSVDSGLLGASDRAKEGFDFNKFDYYYFRKAINAGFSKAEKFSDITTSSEYLVYFRVPKDYVYKPAEASATES